MPIEADNMSGIGPQSGGYRVTQSERLAQIRNDRSTQHLMEFALNSSQQWAQIRKSVVQPMAGGAAAGDDWLYKTRAGFGFRTVANAMMARDPLGYGSPQAMAFGLQQAVGAGRFAIRDMAQPGIGVNRSFGGRGFVTTEMTKQLYTSLQKDLFGGGGRNNVSGLNQTDVGVLASELGSRGAFRGTAGRLREASLGDRLNLAREQVDPRVKREISGVTDMDSLQKRLKAAEEGGDGQVADVLRRVKDNSQILELDDAFAKRVGKIIKATAKTVSTMGEILGSTDQRELLQQSERLIGKAITSEQDALKAKRAIEDVQAFSTARGLDTKQVLEMINTGGAATAAGLQGRGWSAGSAAITGQTISRFSTPQAIDAAGQSGFGGMAGFSMEESAAMINEGLSSRLDENPELIAAAKYLKVNGGTVSADAQRELRGYMQRYGAAGSAEERQNIQAQINKFIHERTGKSAIDWAGGRRGLDMAMKNADINEEVVGLLGRNVGASVMAEGNREAYAALGFDQRAALGGDDAANQGMLGVISSSLKGSSKSELLDIMANRPGDLDAFLKNQEGNLVGADGKKVTADQFKAMLGDQSTFAGKAGAIAAYGRAFEGLDYTKAGLTEEGRNEALALNTTEMLSRGIGLQERVQKRGFLQSLADGFLAGDDGKLGRDALIGLIDEQAGKNAEFKDSKTARFGLKDGKFSDVTMEKLRGLMGGGIDALAAAQGMTAEEYVKALQGGDAAAGNSLMTALRDNYELGSVDGESLTAVDKTSFEKADQMFSEKGRRAAIARKLFTSDSDRARFEGGEDLGRDMVKGLQDTGMITSIWKGNEDDTDKLREMDKLSGGELLKSMMTAADSARIASEDSARSQQDRENSAWDAKKLQAGIEKLQNPADGAGAGNMNVATLTVAKIITPNPIGSN